MDCKTIVDMDNSFIIDIFELGVVLSECNNILSHHYNLKCYLCQEANMVAHSLAQPTIDSTCSIDYSSIPISIHSLVFNEII